MMKWILPTLFLTLFASGCGPSKGSVTGTVTLDGVALKAGKINFVSKSGGIGATATIGDDGSYTVPQLYAGEYSVAVDTEYLKPPSTSMGSGGMGRPGMPMPAPSKEKGVPKDIKPPTGVEIPEGYKMGMPSDNAKKYVKIPGKYADATQSGLTLNSTGGPQTYDIPLTSK